MRAGAGDLDRACRSHELNEAVAYPQDTPDQVPSNRGESFFLASCIENFGVHCVLRSIRFSLTRDCDGRFLTARSPQQVRAKLVYRAHAELAERAVYF